MTAVSMADHLWLLNPRVFHHYAQEIGGSQMDIMTVDTVLSLILTMIQLHHTMSDSVNVLGKMV